MKKTLYVILFISWYFLSLLPFWLLYRVSDLVYYIVYHLVRYRRKIVRKNLTEAFPEKEIEEIIRIEKGFYRFFGDYIVETLKLFSISEKQMRRRMELGGLEELNKDLKTRNCVVYMGHYCNWEWITSLPLHLDKEIVPGQIYHALENEAFNNLFLYLRSRFGGANIEMTTALRQLVLLKQQNKRFVVGFIADQAPNWNNINLWTDFLNHKSAVFTGAERIAKSVNAAVYYLDMVRVKRGYYRGEFVKITDTPKEYTEYQLTIEYAKRLEASICRAPQYWLWSHNRWKRTYEKFLQRKQS